MSRSRLIAFLKTHTSVAKTVSRVSLDRALSRKFAQLAPGVVLDVGASESPYKREIPHTRYVRLDVDAQSHPDICCDVHAIAWQRDYFDTVIATEVLEHLVDPRKAIMEIHRVLKPGGVCIASTRFLYPYHPDPKDYYRFTWDSLRTLFAEFSHVDIMHHGNRLQSLWETMSDFGNSYAGKFLRVLCSPLNLLLGNVEFADTRYPCGFIVVARK